MSASPRLEALLRTMVATIREPEAAERGAAFFAERGLDPRDQAALAAVDPQAMFTYRSLVRGTLRTAAMVKLSSWTRIGRGEPSGQVTSWRKPSGVVLAA